MCVCLVIHPYQPLLILKNETNNKVNVDCYDNLGDK